MLEEKEELMEQKLDDTVPYWKLLDDGDKNLIRNQYRQRDKYGEEHPPGFKPTPKEDEEEMDEQLRRDIPEWCYLLPRDRDYIRKARRWKERGGWGD